MIGAPRPRDRAASATQFGSGTPLMIALHLRHRAWLSALSLLAFTASCSGPETVAQRHRNDASADVPPRDASADVSLRAVLPSAPETDYAPSAASVRGHGELPGDALSAIDRCSVCHADIFAQWSLSAHRFSSLDNPFYFPAFRAAREARGPALTRWCGACHDPALLFAHDIDRAEIDRSHERAAVGVGCLLCHSIERVHDRTGNGNYVVSPDPVVYPPREGEDRVAVERHRARLMRPFLRTTEYCAGCHKVGITEAINNAHWIRGQNEFDLWEQSAYAGNEVERYDPDVERRTCQNCHMPLEPAPLGDRAARNGMVHSHRFSGGHTALAAWVGSSEMMTAEQRALSGAVRLDLFRAPSHEGAEAHDAEPLEARALTPGESLAVDVVMVNERVGHRFPSGTADVADSWVEVVVTNARGSVVAQSGQVTASDPGPLRDDAHRLELRPVDEAGTPALARDPHRYRAVVYDTTIPPRAARVARYTWRVPSGAAFAGPYSVTARLLHRRLGNPFVTTACRTAMADQGRACPTVWPVTVVSTASAVPGVTTSLVRTPALSGSLSAPWRRWYDHGRALVEWNLQERVDQSLHSLERALALAPDRAEPYVERARLSIREGRTDDAYQWLDEAERRAPGAAVIPYLRGVAGSDVWRWSETVAPLGAAWAVAPGNVRLAEMYANSLGIAGRHREAFDVITRGLAIDPERAQLLNLQAIELDALGAHDQASLARTAWDRFRTPDELPGLRSRCKRNVPNCAREVVPLHEHALRSVR